MSNDEFKKKVLETADFIVAGLGKDAIMIKPIIAMAKPILKNTVDKDPEKVKIWLETAREHIQEALELYQNESSEMQLRK
ncbi:MAG: hypothetical protein KC589_08860 [Nanoarchaeota archaeon]|nr:hypothetical protein [Nanoarchaeota archaeon]MCA9497030.1 hypothetical protein [Nanoarchaeota archaeon]